jgi:hypothetical protein
MGEKINPYDVLVRKPERKKTAWKKQTQME